MAEDPLSVALVGVHGHGAEHLRAIGRQQRAGLVRLAGLCDLRPPGPAALATHAVPPPVFTDHRELFAVVRPDVTVVATPPHTHLRIAADAVHAGSDLLLEKPPVVSLAEHDELAGLLGRTGRLCQIGFQSLASPAFTVLLDAVRAGWLGSVTGIAATGRWIRDDAYYRRGDWVGRARVAGVPTLDGALTNPFAHLVMQSLAVADAAGGGDVRRLAVERYRARDLEVDDTSCLRIELAGGLRCIIAVTLCAEEFAHARLVVHGTAGRADAEYKTNRVRLPGWPAARVLPHRPDLLENLIAHRRDPAVPLFVPLHRTVAFTHLVELLRLAPPPERVPEAHRPARGDGPGRHFVVAGVDRAVDRAGAGLALFSELSVPWARQPFVIDVEESECASTRSPT